MQKEIIDHDLGGWGAVARKALQAARAVSPAAWIFLAFFAVMLVQHRFVYLYMDDFGYASLRFAVQPIRPVDGHAYSLAQAVEFLYLHYLHWGGRVLVFAIELALLRWGFWPFRIAQSVVIVLILWLIYRLLRQNAARDARARADGPLSALLLCGLYGLIQVEVQRQGAYWFSSAVLYVWPFAFLFAGGLLHARMVSPAAMGLLYFAAGISQEQTGLAAVVFLLGVALTHWLRRREVGPVETTRLLRTDAAALVCALAGYAVLMAAPGNVERFAHPSYQFFLELDLAGKLRRNLPLILDLITGKHNLPFLLLWAWASVFSLRAGYRAARSAPRLRWAALGLYALGCAYAVLLSVMVVPGLAARVKILFDPGFHTSYLLFWSGFLAVNSLAVLWFCLPQRQEPLFFLFLGGLGSQAAMIVSPSIALRSTLIFLFALFPVLVLMIVDTLAKASAAGPRWRLIARAALALVIAVSAFNTQQMIRGYAGNADEMEANHQALLHAAQEIEQGARPVTLRKLTDERFSAEMPYFEHYEYINYWIKAYYGLPAAVELIWK